MDFNECEKETEAVTGWKTGKSLQREKLERGLKLGSFTRAVIGR